MWSFMVNNTSCIVYSSLSTSNKTCKWVLAKFLTSDRTDFHKSNLWRTRIISSTHLHFYFLIFLVFVGISEHPSCSLPISPAYSILFNDSTISIFFNLKYMTKFTIQENRIVNSVPATKLSRLILRPNIVLSTSTVVMTKR